MSTTPSTTDAELAAVLEPTPEQPPVTKRFIASYVFLQLAAWTALLTPLSVTLALRVAELVPPENKGAQLGMILSAGAFAAMIGAPVWGAVSDRTRARIGRRKFWMLAGTTGLLVGLLIVAFAPSIPVMLVGWVLCQLMANATQTAILSVMADRVPEHQRGTVAGMLGFTLTLGTLLGTGITTLLAGNLLLSFLVPWLLLPIGLVLFFKQFRDHPAVKGALPRFSFGELLRTFWVNPFRHHDYGLAFTSRAFTIFGTAFFVAFQVYFLTDHLGVGLDVVAAFVFASTFVSAALTVIVSFGCGLLSDRVRRRKPFLIAASLSVATGLVLIATSTGFPQFIAGAGLVAAGRGLYVAMGVTVTVAVLPDKRKAANYIGLMQIANSGPQMLAPAIAPLFFAIGAAGTNYVAGFLIAGAAALIGALAMIPIRATR